MIKDVHRFTKNFLEKVAKEGESPVGEKIYKTKFIKKVERTFTLFEKRGTTL